MKNVVVTYLTGGGGGGGGGAWEEIAGFTPTSQADCDPYDAKFLTASQNGVTAVCVTKYNIGDIPSATNGGIATSVTTVSAGTNCSGSCCWRGKTADGCDSSGTSYSGCNRTVCTADVIEQYALGMRQMHLVQLLLTMEQKQEIGDYPQRQK